MTSVQKTTLGLELPTDPRWVNLAEKNLADILTDHAYCELKAATTCISLIQLHPDKAFLVDQLVPVVAEEWGHFNMVIRIIRERGYDLGQQRKDEYVNGLMHFQKKGGSNINRLIEKLLMCALIEARSCERFRLLSLELDDVELKAFYHNLMISEAGHYRLFLDLAYKYGDKKDIQKRWNEYLSYEAEVISKLDADGRRIH